MKVSLFITCLVDQLCPEVGVATVKVLEMPAARSNLMNVKPAAVNLLLTPDIAKKPKNLPGDLSKSLKMQK